MRVFQVQKSYFDEKIEVYVNSLISWLVPEKHLSIKPLGFGTITIKRRFQTEKLEKPWFFLLETASYVVSLVKQKGIGKININEKAETNNNVRMSWDSP